MYHSQLNRAQDAQAHSPPSSMPAVPTSPSSSSLSSSFSSSAASSVLLPAAPPCNSSQSDIAHSDHSASSLTGSSSSKSRFFPLSLSSRSAPLTHMGQGYSRSSPVHPSTSSVASNTAGGRFKRVWAGRRKKPEDVTVLLDSPKQPEKGKERERHDSSKVAAAPDGGPQVQPGKTSARIASGTKHFIPIQLSSSLGMFGNKKPAQQPQPPKPSKFSAPQPPPHPSSLSANDVQATRRPSWPLESAHPRSEQRSSTILMSPGISAAIQMLQAEDEGKSDMPSPKEKSDREKKQDWRKSDSTTTSHNTIRPGAFGNRSPRPVSLAESSHSANTIVPSHKRLSALITEAEFAMAEESETAESDQESRVPVSGRPSPTPSVKAQHRRSMSFNFGGRSVPRSSAAMPESSGLSSSEVAMPSLSRTFSDSPSLSPYSSRDTPTLTKAAARGFIAPVNAPDAPHTTGSDIRGRLAAWTASAAPPMRMDQPLPSLPQPSPQPRQPPVSSGARPSFRQTKMSISSPAAGFGRRAAEKVHRALGLGSSSSNASTHSSSSISTPPPSYCNPQLSEHSLARTSSKESAPRYTSPTGWKVRRRTPDGAWSIASTASSSASESEGFAMPTGPTLGTRIRGPKRNGLGASVAAGLVFKRDLESCVRDTAIDRTRLPLKAGVDSTSADTAYIKPLEDRVLPALVVRCAQHLRKWGVQEEGLFRINGRHAHVAKLRSEFDTGADYDLVECDPGDLDPHAVASILKAYLRELPESLLTVALMPNFESVLAHDAEGEAATEGIPSMLRRGNNPGLPSGPRAGAPLPLRKPPSLSTLAMPSFAGMRAMSADTIGELASLITRLPEANRDLLFTVVELIQATAANSKETKMPLGNLLLVFCPSLNMSPALLRVLCENTSIWAGQDAKAKESKTSTETQPLPHAETTPEHPGGSEARTSTEHPEPATTEEVLSLHDISLSLSNDDIPPTLPRVRYGRSRGPIATIYARNPQDPLPAHLRPYSAESTADDSASYVSAPEDPADPSTQPSSAALDSPHIPPLSSSTDSLTSPSTTSEDAPLSLSSFHPKPSDEDKADLQCSGAPVIAETIDLPLPSTPRRPLISSPIPFPSTGGNSPHTPISHRKSFALLSFPPLRSEPSSPSGTSGSWSLRAKRPSLRIFSKRSASSLIATSSLSPSAPPSSSSTPNRRMASLSAESLPSPPMIPSVPPVLDTPISSSPMGLGFVPGPEGTKDQHGDTAITSLAAAGTSMIDDPPALRIQIDSCPPSLFSTPQQTPIASHFLERPFTPSIHPDQGRAISPSALRRSASQASFTPSIDIGLEGDTGEDWVQSVLMAAHA